MKFVLVICTMIYILRHVTTEVTAEILFEVIEKPASNDQMIK